MTYPETTMLEIKEKIKEKKRKEKKRKIKKRKVKKNIHFQKKLKVRVSQSKKTNKNKKTESRQQILATFQNAG